METNEIVGRNLKALRTSTGYTQDEVAQALAIGRAAYANYESGLREVPFDILEKISLLYGCDMYLLFDEEGVAKESVLATAFRISGLSEEDNAQIMRFKDIVRTYIKLDHLANEHNLI